MYVQAARDFDVERKAHAVNTLKQQIAAKEEALYALRFVSFLSFYLSPFFCLCLSVSFYLSLFICLLLSVSFYLSAFICLLLSVSSGLSLSL